MSGTRACSRAVAGSYNFLPVSYHWLYQLKTSMLGNVGVRHRRSERCYSAKTFGKIIEINNHNEKKLHALIASR